MKIIITNDVENSAINKRLHITDTLTLNAYSIPLTVNVDGLDKVYDGMQINAGDVLIADDLLAAGVNVSDDGLMTLANNNAEEYEALIEHIKNLSLLDDTSSILINTYINKTDNSETIIAVNRAAYDNRVYGGTNDERFNNLYTKQNTLLLSEFHFKNINYFLNNQKGDSDQIYTYLLNLTTYLKINEEGAKLTTSKPVSAMCVELIGGGRFGDSLKINGHLLANGIYMTSKTPAAIANIENYLNSIKAETTAEVNVVASISEQSYKSPDIPSAYKTVKITISKEDIYQGKETKDWDFVTLAYFK